MRTAIPILLTVMSVVALEAACSAEAATPAATPGTCVSGTVSKSARIRPMHAGHGGPEVAPPLAYKDRFNPFQKAPDVIARGRDLYRVECASCHGERGGGDGPAASSLAPPPANLRVGGYSEPYLFWRITEGGETAPFCSSMPSFFDGLDERQRWAVATYVSVIGDAPDDGGTPADAEVDAGPPEQPEMRSVGAMGGGLHVTWRLRSPCSLLRLERRRGAEAFKVAYTLVGYATDQHDTQVSGSDTYCYRLICERGGASSAPSGEMCGQP